MIKRAMWIGLNGALFLDLLLFGGKSFVFNGFPKFKGELKRLTGRSWFVTMDYRMKKLGQYIRGWINYYGISEYYRPIPELDQWLRRRISPDISRVACTHIQGIRVADVVVYLKALVTQKMGALGSPEG